MTLVSSELLEVDVESATPEAARPLMALAPRAIAFRPEEFFLGRTEGAGVIRDPFGRVIRRCNVVTEGSRGAGHGAIRFEEVFAYDDGEIDTWRWVMSPSRDGRYVAAEAKAGAGITGERRGGDYVLSFRRPVGKATGALAPRFETRFTQLSADVVLKHVKLSLLGLPLGQMTAIHRRVD